MEKVINIKVTEDDVEMNEQYVTAELPEPTGEEIMLPPGEYTIRKKRGNPNGGPGGIIYVEPKTK